MIVFKLFSIIFISSFVSHVKGEELSAKEILELIEPSTELCDWFTKAQCGVRGTSVLGQIAALNLGSSVEEIKTPFLTTLEIVDECWDCFVGNEVPNLLCSGIREAGKLLTDHGVSIPIPSECILFETGPVGGISPRSRLAETTVSPMGEVRNPFGSLLESNIAKKFVNSVTRSVKYGREVEHGIEELFSSSNDVRNILSVPKELKNNLVDLRSGLNTLEDVLKIIQFVPAAGGVTKALKVPIRKLKEALSEAFHVLSKLTKKIKPLDTKVKQLESKVKSLRKIISKAVDIQLTMRNNAKNIDPDWNTPSLTKMDSVTVDMIAPIDEFGELQQNIIGVIESTEYQLREVKHALSAVSNVADEVVEITNLVEPIMRVLRPIKSALDEEVCADKWKYICMSVSDALDNPVSAFLDRAVNAIFDSLNFDIPNLRSDIPGLEKINQAAEVISRVESAIPINQISTYSVEANAAYDELLGFNNDIWFSGLPW